ncbi:MAG: hypothetical protein ACJAZR_001525, partial [Sediminicola sp.]
SKVSAFNKVSAKLKVKCILVRYFSYTQTVGNNMKEPK